VPFPANPRKKRRRIRQCLLDSDGGKNQSRSVTERDYKIDELARAAGMSVRTVRYYVQRGLLPAAAFRGKDTAYDHGHLLRLRAIRRLQEAFFPLDAIAVELDGRSPREIEEIADGKVTPVSRLGTADDDDEPHAAIARQASRLYRRIELFPGVELTVAEDAPDQSVRLVKEMLAILEAKSKGREGGRKR
jgi:DNA-binding transcriptional MerR regulator